ncbi:MAG: SDR family oxidoreductase [Firmicutes bacterium]|nr:SDR family oxidoreductase [Bacillota bacterium]
MKVVITGGAGFIGSHLCQRFIADGVTVVCIDNFCTSRKSNIAELLKHRNFSLLIKDVIQPFTDYELIWLAGVNVVIHLASPASPEQYRRLDLETALVNSTGTKNMLDLALKEGARFVLASTSEIYGDPEEHPQSEKYWGHVNPVGPRSHYDESKRFAEMLTMLYHRKYGLDTRIARIFNTYGPGMQAEDGRVIPNFITQALQGKSLTIYGDGSQTRSFCYIDDLIDGLYRLTMLPNLGGTIVNLGNQDEYEIKEIAALITSLCSSPASYTYCKLPEDDPVRRRPDITKAKELLDWAPQVPLVEGLARTIEHFSQTGS